MTDPLETLWNEIDAAGFSNNQWSDILEEYMRLYSQGPKAKEYLAFLLS